MVTTTPSDEELAPTASQVVALEQATPASPLVPETTWALPGVPSVMVTTTPWFEELAPTASQVVALEQATPPNQAVPETTWVVVLALTMTPRALAPAMAATRIGIMSQRILVVTDEPPGSFGQPWLPLAIVFPLLSDTRSGRKSPVQLSMGDLIGDDNRT
jgi:hypothetical protein